MKVRMTAASAAVLAVGLLAAGCGSSSTTTSSGTSGVQGVALSAGEFASQGNAICAAGNKVLSAADKSTFTSKNPSDAELQSFADVAVPSIQGQIDDIRALAPPADQADKVTAFLDAAQTALDKVKADPGLFAGNAFGGVNKLAVGVGLKTCAG